MKKLPVSLIDNKTGLIIGDINVLKLFSKALFDDSAIDKLETEIEKLRFQKLIRDFRSNSVNPIEFYLQHKKEIESDCSKKSQFLNSFGYFDESKFNSQLKKVVGYPEEFYDQELREDILYGQNGLCGICGCNIKSISPHLHHIDYNKKNCSKSNLVFLCPRCHGKTNSNRDFWQKLLREYQQEKKPILES